MINDPKTVRDQWAAHRSDCAACASYVEGKPSTLGGVCVIGAPLIKDVLELDAQPPKQ